jgi:hypothetical protein
MALITTGYCQHFEIVLEEPHPSIVAAEIDLRIIQGEARPSSVFEFKFDRTIPSQRNLPSTQKAGAVFKDLFRLARTPLETAPMRYFIYFTTVEMARYFKNPSNRFTGFYNLAQSDLFPLSSEFITAQASTFQAVIKNFAVSCNVIGSYQRDYSTGHALRIYQVIS